MNSNWIIIGIGGATCSGKTTVAKELNNRIPESVLIHQDDFYLPSGSPQLEFIEEVQHYNWDSLSAIETKRFVEEIQNIINNKMSGQRTLIIDGHFIYAIPEIATLCTKKYFFVVSKETALYRRRTRKYKRFDERYFHKYAWPSFESHQILTFKTYKDLTVLDGELELALNVDIILGDIVGLVSQPQITSSFPH